MPWNQGHLEFHFLGCRKTNSKRVGMLRIGQGRGEARGIALECAELVPAFASDEGFDLRLWRPRPCSAKIVCDGVAITFEKWCGLHPTMD